MSPTFTGLIEVGRSTLVTRLFDMDNISQNLANFNNFGYKATRQNFQEVLNASSQKGINALSGNGLTGTQTLLQQGALIQQSEALNMAIQGEGFFAVTLPDGRKAYTRNGEFRLDGQGNIANASGYALDWTGSGAAMTNFSEIAVDRDGTVRVKDAGATTYRVAGQVNMYRFTNPTALQGYGDNMWLPTSASGAPISGAPASSRNFGQVIGNSLEGSNVNMAEEASRMVVVQRSFDLATRNLKMTDEMMAQAIHMRQ
jgi:flagellar basal-body rod protein FlgG